MSNKSSPRRRSTRRYDEDYEYYVPVRYYNKVKSEPTEADNQEPVDIGKRKRGKSSDGVKVKDLDSKRGPGRPRRYPSAQEEGPSDSKPIELNIVSYQPEAVEAKKEKKRIQLGEVLELAVQSMSVTMAEEDSGDRVGQTQIEKSSHNATITESDGMVNTTGDQDSDFEWKLETEEDVTSHSPPTKRKKIVANSSVIVPTNTDEFEELEEDGEGRIQVRTIVVGEGEGARIECLSCHRIMKPNSLKAHLKTHAHERPHACDLCDARFTRRGDLERHIKVVHNKDRPFKCSKCHRAFGDKKNLRWHLNNHDRKLFHHCQVCGFKFGKREYWENHVRYIHPIPGTDLEPIPSEVSDAEKEEAANVSGDAANIYRKIDPVAINKMLNGNKGTPALVYANRANPRRPSADPFAGLKPPKIVHPPTYWDNWEEYMKRKLVLRFKPSIQRFGASGRPLRRKKVPETVVELQPEDRPDSQFDIEQISEDQTLLDDQTGAFVTPAGEFIGYPETICKAEDRQADEEEEEELEEDNGMNVGEILEQPGIPGEVLSTHHLVYGEDGQVRLMVGSGVDGQHELVEGNGYDENDEEALLRGDLGHAFVESGQIVIMQPDGSAVLAPPGGQLVDTGDGQLILIQTLEDGTQAAVAYATAAPASAEDDVSEAICDDDAEDKTESTSNQDAVQTLIDAVQELIDGRQKPS